MLSRLLLTTVALVVSSTMAHGARLENISTRGYVGTGDEVLIGGFIIGGSSPKRIIIRARGPSLEGAVDGALSDPTVTLRSASGEFIATNDNYRDAANWQEIPAARLPTNDRESALLLTLEPGAYTPILRGVGGDTGIGIIEIFEYDDTGIFSNISTRGWVGTGDEVLIGGFIVRGTGDKRVVIRVRAPSLTGKGVEGALANPEFVLRSMQGEFIASNADWVDGDDASGIPEAYRPRDASEAAIVLTLPPGAYTPIVRGTDGATGIAVVEVFDIDGEVTPDPTRIVFDPLGSGNLPYPNNWFFEGGDGRRLNIPGGAFVQQANLQDGFSTINAIRFEFDRAIDGGSLLAGENVRVFEATVDSDSRQVISIDAELEAGTDFVVELSNLPASIGEEEPANTRVLIKPLLPFRSSTGTGDGIGYVVLVTGGIRDTWGLAAETNEVFEAVSGSDALSDTPLAELENLRQQTVGWMTLLDSFVPGLRNEEVIVSFSFTTRSTTDALEAVAANATAGTLSAIDDAPTGGTSMNYSVVFGGTLTVPNYRSGSAGLWLDASGERVIRFDPMPVQAGTVDVPFYAALPSASGCTRPAAGWPVVIYDGGGQNSPLSLVAHFNSESGTDLLPIADEFGVKCLATVTLSRGLPGGLSPASADYFRQAAANLVHLVRTLPDFDLDADGNQDFDATSLAFAGHSAGADAGIMLAAVEPNVRTIVVSGPNAGTAKALDGSALRQPGLEAGLDPVNRRGSASYEAILNIIQGAMDDYDSLNYVGKLRPSQAFHLIEVYGGGILPGPIGTGAGNDYVDTEGNFLNPGDVSQPPSVVNEGYWQVVETAPLAGMEALVRVMDLASAASTLDHRASGVPLRTVTRFGRGHHSSGYIEKFLGFGVIDVSEEWRRQQLEFILSDGLYLPVTQAPGAHVLSPLP